MKRRDLLPRNHIRITTKNMKQLPSGPNPLTNYNLTGSVVGIVAIGDDIAMVFEDFQVDTVLGHKRIEPRSIITLMIVWIHVDFFFFVLDASGFEFLQVFCCPIRD